MILEFTTEAEAQACLDSINQLAVNYWQEQGYTVIEEDGKNKLIGKNAKTNVDQPSKTKTETWDIVQTSPDNTYYFASLTGTPYEAAMQQLSEAFSFTEKEFPQNWIQGGDDV